MLTDGTPRPASSRAASIAVLPPPMTTARRRPATSAPIATGPSFIRSIHSTAPRTPGPLSPGMPSVDIGTEAGAEKQRHRNRAPAPRRSGRARSRPRCGSRRRASGRTPPRARASSAGILYGATPEVLSPPARRRFSKIVTAKPSSARYDAQASDAGPAPTQATRLPLAGARGSSARRPACAQQCLGRVALQAADGDRRVAVPGVVDAGPRAEHLDGTDARARVAEHVGGEDRSGRAPDVVRADLADERRYVDAGRARRDARRVLAIQAPVGLQQAPRPASRAAWRPGAAARGDPRGRVTIFTSGVRRKVTGLARDEPAGTADRRELLAVPERAAAGDRPGDAAADLRSPRRCCGRPSSGASSRSACARLADRAARDRRPCRPRSSPCREARRSCAGAVLPSSTMRGRSKRPPQHAVGVEQQQAILDARGAVRDLREVVLARRLLLLRERAVVGADGVEHAGSRARATARRGGRVPGPDRRAHDVGRALEVGLVEHRVVEQQVLRAGLAVAALAASLARSSASTASRQVMCTM